MGLISLRLENNGDVIPISSYLPKDFLRNAGARGFGVAPTKLDIREGAGGGGRWRNTRRGPRALELPLTIFGSNAVDVEAKLRRLVRLLNDKFSTPTIYVTYPDGRELFTDVHYAGGADPIFGVDSNQRDFAKILMTLRSPSPYWSATDTQQYSLAAANAGRGLIKNAPLTKLQISSAQTIGSVLVENDGDVDAFPVWNIRGPGTAFTATRQADGATFTYDATITNVNPITIDAETKKVTDASDVNVYTNLSYAPKLFSIPPGASTIDIEMVGSDATSLVTFYFRPRYELVFG